MLEQAEALEQAINHELSGSWLELEYRRCLYGGWLREDGSPAPGHRKAYQFHMAARAAFCPKCDHQVGYVGSDEDEKWDCRKCGAKDLIIPPEEDEPGDYMMTAPTFTKHFPLTQNKYFKERMLKWIVKEATIKNQQKVETQFTLTNGKVVHCLSYDQYVKCGKNQVSPYEGPRWRSVWADEPIPQGAWIATKRGLLRAVSQFDSYPYVQGFKVLFLGGGNQSSKSFSGCSEFCAQLLGYAPWDGSLRRFRGVTQITATPLRCAWMYHDIYKKAWNRGGDSQYTFAMEMSVYDNPSMTKKAVEKFFADGIPSEDFEARVHGRFRFLSGRIFPEYDAMVHDYDPATFDPLKKGGDPNQIEPSDAPIIMSIDPHFRKPWFMVWMAVMPDGTKYVVNEWPHDAFHKMHSSRIGLDRYAEIIREEEEKFPGGSQRVIWREFDPNLSRVPIPIARESSSFGEEMMNRGFDIRTDVNDDHNFGHHLIHTHLAYEAEADVDLLNRPTMFVSTDCHNVRFSFENYVWDDYADSEMGLKNKPKDLGKDGMDCVRYCLAREPAFMDWHEVVGGAVSNYDDALFEIENW